MRFSTVLTSLAAFAVLNAAPLVGADALPPGTSAQETQPRVSAGRFNTPSDLYAVDGLEVGRSSIALSITRASCGRSLGATFRIARDAGGELRGRLVFPVREDNEMVCLALVPQRVRISTREIIREAIRSGLVRTRNSIRLNLYGSKNENIASNTLR